MESKSPTMEEKMVALDKNNEHEGGEDNKVPIEEKEVVYPGFRFHPTDEELVAFYLRRKLEKKTLSIALIKEIDIYKYDPWDLPISNVGEKEWYFFCLRGRKYRNSIRPNRVTGSGFWKATGIDRPIYPSGEHNHNRECIGLKKSLVYYRGSAGKGTKTDWMMHEFRLPSNNADSTIIPEAEIWTICRILKRNITYKKYVPSWKDPLNKQIPADSNSKTSSFDSGIKDEYTGFGFTAIQQDDQKLATTYTQETNQSFAGQWNPMAQSPLTPLPLPPNTPLPLPPNIASLSSNEFYRPEGIWDELGYMVDPALIYECRYL